MVEKNNQRPKAAEGGLVLLVGVALLAAGAWAASQLHIVWSIWPSADGIVMNSTVQEVDQVGAAKGEALIHRYRPQVEFRYRVGGKEYTTQAVSEHTTDTYQKAEANLLHLYGRGTHHPIRVNPRDPRDIRFGTIALSPLVFAFLIMVGGAALIAGGLNSLAGTYAQLAGRAPAVAGEALGAVLPFEDRSRVEPAAVTLRCPACGRRVEAGDNTCPNCLKSLRAA